MMRIAFLILWIIPLLAPQARAAIEIYVNGHKFDSFQAYLASKKSAIVKSVPKAVSLNSQQENYIRNEAEKLGIKVDFGKVKTFEVDGKNLSDGALHKLYVMSVESGMVGALRDFYQSWGGQSALQMPRRISSDQLQGAIQQAVIASKEPKLLISGQGKVRIMTLTTEHSQEQ